MSHAYVILEGAISFTTVADARRSPARLLRSGQLFPLRLFNVFGVYVGVCFFARTQPKAPRFRVECAPSLPPPPFPR